MSNDKKILLNSKQVDLITRRISHQISENHLNIENSVLIGMQPRGVFFAKLLHEIFEEEFNFNIPYGELDSTFYRDDFRRRDEPLTANQNNIPFLIEDKNVILIDDVLFTGRTIRAALDAMQAFGRPKNVELAVLIERKYARELPIEAKYIGKSVNSQLSQKVIVDLQKEKEVWLINES